LGFGQAKAIWASVFAQDPHPMLAKGIVYKFYKKTQGLP